jgi:hypothetical protein
MTILAAVMLGVVAVALTVTHVDRGPRTLCLSQLKQLGVANQMYLADFDRLPDFAWSAALEPYTRNANLFRCPQVKTGFGYAMNPYLARAPLPTNPELTPLLFDTPNLSRDALMVSIAPIAEDRHRGRINVVFAEGRVKALELPQAQALTMRPDFPPSESP